MSTLFCFDISTMVYLFCPQTQQNKQKTQHQANIVHYIISSANSSGHWIKLFDKTIQLYTKGETTKQFYIIPLRNMKKLSSKGAFSPFGQNVHWK